MADVDHGDLDLDRCFRIPGSLAEGPGSGRLFSMSKFDNRQ